MSLSLSATGWSAAGTLLAAFTGSADGSLATSFGGSVAAGGTGVAVAVSALAGLVFAGSCLAGSGGSVFGGSVLAGSVLAVSLFGASAAGVVATSEGLVSTLTGAGAASAFAASLVGSFTESCTVAVVSGLMGAADGGGMLAGSGRGIAASIASSAALLRA